ncbi:MAG: DUF4982 domain-containing protein [Lutibacter sp.]|uniref:beta-galactosidase GalB n=1 Tax=Lutibacter sp. TaxID=1925666 RepID=UPI0019EA19B3|nr:beta-galactosidase GalB [Lutibacter sp.]NOR27958.1 DUF4982 domain-containing protein [Lutibacter sp.]
MKKYSYLLLYIIGLVSCTQPQERTVTSFNENWFFTKGKISGAENPTFDDSSWRVLDVPHDWAIEGPFAKENNARSGGLPFFGEAWYRKHFNVNDSLKGKIITVEFDGIMSNSTIYLNGKKIGERPYGYIGFQVDLTPYLKYNEDNVLAVKVAPENYSSRWYPGAGIYRNVRMEVKNPTHVAFKGTYVTTPKITDAAATVKVETTINSKELNSGKFELETSVVDALGVQVASTSSEFKITDKNTKKIEQNLSVENPNRWDLDNPYLYSVKTVLKKNGVSIDTYNTTFGIRTIEFTSEEGFVLNGRKERFRGVCLHHDLGPLGSAVNYRATQRQLEIMKEMGINAIRTSHNPTSPEQLELCDKMGILVIAEAFDGWKIPKVENDYNKYWDEWHEKDLRDMLKRDRNHPSVVMWSIGNEMNEQRHKNGGKIAKMLTDICHEEDITRPVTAGFNAYPHSVKNGLAAAIDIVGFNYKPTQYNNLLKKHPDWIVYGAETSSCVSSRGVYHLPLEKYNKHESLQVSSYDIISPPWAYAPDIEFNAQETMTKSLGEFVWTGFDYLGEPTPYGGRDNHTHGNWSGDWPSRSSYFGTVDLCGFPKDRFYLYQSVWTKKPMVHILPHWNWEEQNVEKIPVYAYSNCEEAELFLNGKSLGRKTMGIDKTTLPINFNWWKRPETTWDSPYRLNWNVKYEPGELKIVAYNNNVEVASKIIKTASKPAQIKLNPDRSTISADGKDLSFITIKIEDKNGNFCPLADNLVKFKITGPGTIAAVGNGNAATLEPFQADYRKAFNGLCMLIIKSEKGEKGAIQIEATSEGLSLGKVVVTSK